MRHENNNSCKLEYLRYVTKTSFFLDYILPFLYICAEFHFPKRYNVWWFVKITHKLRICSKKEKNLFICVFVSIFLIYNKTEIKIPSSHESRASLLWFIPTIKFTHLLWKLFSHKKKSTQTVPESLFQKFIPINYIITKAVLFVAI